MSQIPEPKDSLQETEIPVSGLPHGPIEGMLANTPRATRGRKGPFLILTNDGIKFAKRWFRSRTKVPPKKARLYQLIIKIVMMKGVITFIGAQRIGYSNEVIQDALSRGYIRLTRKFIEPSKEVKKQIIALIGKDPKRIYT